MEQGCGLPSQPPHNQTATIAYFYPMAQDYDKIFREVLKDIFPAVAQKVLGIPPGTYKPLPVDLQYTSEREADQVWEITPVTGEPFVRWSV